VIQSNLGIKDLTLSVLGLGHVGLPTALGFAELGWNVIGADDDLDKTRMLSLGQTPFYEPGIKGLLDKHLESGRFKVATDSATAVKESDVLFVCVGTPQSEDGSADLSQVENAARTVAQNTNGYKLIVEKSTNPVSTAENVKMTISQYLDTDHQVEVAVNPEFLREGRALEDFFNPDRIVIGVESERAKDLLFRIYEPLINNINQNGESANQGEVSPYMSGQKIVVTDLNTAELIKHSSNAFLAMKVSFINMVSDLCESAGADVNDVAIGLGMDPRIGPDFLRAGVGFGGYCLPKDLKAFIRIAKDNCVDESLLEAIEMINDQRVDRFVSKLALLLDGLAGRKLAVWGLAFKPETDDVRDAPSIKIVQRLLEHGASVILYDPQATDQFMESFQGSTEKISCASSALDAAVGAEAVLLLCEWEEFKLVDLEELRSRVDGRVVLDGRNFLDKKLISEMGFSYYGMGR
tara:strand:- start:18870 stop:20264 length:1395 start_codon:yes stop_codon:yes gene_type:complete